MLPIGSNSNRFVSQQSIHLAAKTQAAQAVVVAAQGRPRAVGKHTAVSREISQAEKAAIDQTHAD